LKKIQDETDRMENPATQLENTKESIRSRMCQTEDRISRFNDTGEDLDQIIKEYEKN
jgi:TolA-binding protein